MRIAIGEKKVYNNEELVASLFVLKRYYGRLKCNDCLPVVRNWTRHFVNPWSYIANYQHPYFV